jgi:hypothetical protein
LLHVSCHDEPQDDGRALTDMSPWCAQRHEPVGPDLPVKGCYPDAFCRSVVCPHFRHSPRPPLPTPRDVPPCQSAPYRCPSLPKSPFPRPSPQGTPETLPSSILRRLSSTSQSHAAPCSAWLWGAPARSPRRAGRRAAGVVTRKCRLFFLSVAVWFRDHNLHCKAGIDTDFLRWPHRLARSCSCHSMSTASLVCGASSVPSNVTRCLTSCSSSSRNEHEDEYGVRPSSRWREHRVRGERPGSQR